jgi:hypothetical protein
MRSAGEVAQMWRQQRHELTRPAGGSATMSGTPSSSAKLAARAPGIGSGLGTCVRTSAMPRASISALNARAPASSPRPGGATRSEGGRNGVVASGHGDISQVPLERER